MPSPPSVCSCALICVRAGTFALRCHWADQRTVPGACPYCLPCLKRLAGLRAQGNPSLLLCLSRKDTRIIDVRCIPLFMWGLRLLGLHGKGFIHQVLSLPPPEPSFKTRVQQPTQQASHPTLPTLTFLPRVQLRRSVSRV